MKLLFCVDCQDVRKLNKSKTHCNCRRSWGQYEADGHKAVVGGKALVMAIENSQLQEALTRKLDAPARQGQKLDLYILGAHCSTVRREQ